MVQQLKILFEEDEPDIRTIVALALGRDPDFSLTTYGSGVEALEDIERRSHSFDFALLNMRLPSMTGIELHEKLRQLPQLSGLRTAIITAGIRPHEVDAYKRPGVVGVIAQPFDPLSLSDRVRVLVAGR